MKLKNAKYIWGIIAIQFLVFGASFAVQTQVYAFGEPIPVNSQRPQDPNCTYDAQNTGTGQQFCNPLPDKNIGELLARLLKFFLTAVLGAAVVFVAIAGFKMIVAGGNEEAVTSARKMMTWALIGLVVTSLAYTLVAVVENILFSGNPGN